MCEPKISVIIPTYNKWEYLPQAMDSLLKQTIGFENLQVLLIDDCSEDGTWELNQAYAKKYGNVETFRTQANSGAPGLPRNMGLDHARAPYVMFLDPDDWYNADACEILYDKITESDAQIISASYVRRFPDEVKQHGGADEWSIEYLLPDALMELLPRRLQMWSKIYDRKMLEQVHIRFPQGVFGEDTVFLCKCFTAAKKYIQFNHNVYNYRICSNSLTNTQGEAFFQKNDGSIERCMDVLRDYPEAAGWMLVDQSSYYIRKAMEFDALGLEELQKIFTKYKNLFDPSGPASSRNVVSVLIREGRPEIAAEYLLNKREETKEAEKNRNQLLQTSSDLRAASEKRQDLEEKFRSLMEENSEQKKTIDSQSENILRLDTEKTAQNETMATQLQSIQRFEKENAAHRDLLASQIRTLECLEKADKEHSILIASQNARIQELEEQHGVKEQHLSEQGQTIRNLVCTNTQQDRTIQDLVCANTQQDQTIRDLVSENILQRDTITLLQNQLENIRGNRFYRLFCGVYKWVKNLKAALIRK